MSNTILEALEQIDPRDIEVQVGGVEYIGREPSRETKAVTAERRRREAEDVATRLEAALTGGSAEVLGSLQSQIGVFPHILVAAELRVAECELALARCQVPHTESRFWVTDEQRKLAEEQARYQECRSWQNGEEARAASQAWAALNTRVHGLEVQVTRARQELQGVSQGARQRAQRVAASAKSRR